MIDGPVLVVVDKRSLVILALTGATEFMTLPVAVPDLVWEGVTADFGNPCAFALNAWRRRLGEGFHLLPARPDARPFALELASTASVVVLTEDAATRARLEARAPVASALDWLKVLESAGEVFDAAPLVAQAEARFADAVTPAMVAALPERDVIADALAAQLVFGRLGFTAV